MLYGIDSRDMYHHENDHPRGTMTFPVALPWLPGINPEELAGSDSNEVPREEPNPDPDI